VSRFNPVPSALIVKMSGLPACDQAKTMRFPSGEKEG